MPNVFRSSRAGVAVVAISAVLLGGCATTGNPDDPLEGYNRAMFSFNDQVDKRYAFPADTTASILTSGLLGEQYVGLEAGADTAMLESGDRVLITQSAVVLEKLIGQFMFDRAADAPPAQ